MTRRRAHRRAPGGRRRRPRLLAALAVTVLLTGCAPASPDPQLVSAAQDALAADQTLRLGVRQQQGHLLLDTTASVIYDDMRQQLADIARQLETTDAATAADGRYRAAVLTALRTALEGADAAARGDLTQAERLLARASAALHDLERQP
ncbi:hypothetical protein [Microbacterium luticocti]|uniref:hypothetical protein n=1 Tax=Microbacterium luticocti TaxID=451764 RepID=UPI0004212923|nr:hypothetical protein [Microbacterium luticocti]